MRSAATKWAVMQTGCGGRSGRSSLGSRIVYKTHELWNTPAGAVPQTLADSLRDVWHQPFFWRTQPPPEYVDPDALSRLGERDRLSRRRLSAADGVVHCGAEAAAQPRKRRRLGHVAGAGDSHRALEQRGHPFERSVPEPQQFAAHQFQFHRLVAGSGDSGNGRAVRPAGRRSRPVGIRHAVHDDDDLGPRRADSELVDRDWRSPRQHARSGDRRFQCRADQTTGDRRRDRRNSGLELPGEQRQPVSCRTNGCSRRPIPVGCGSRLGNRCGPGPGPSTHASPVRSPNRFKA